MERRATVKRKTKETGDENHYLLRAMAYNMFPELDTRREAEAFINNRRFSDPALKKMWTGLKVVCNISSPPKNMFGARLRRKYPMLGLLNWEVRQQPSAEARKIILNYIMEK